MYRRSKRLKGGNAADIAENIGYAFGKAQKDQQRSAARLAFARNAMANGWSSENMGSLWAKAVYGKKDIDVTQWYSKPEYYDAAGNKVDNARAAAGVRFKDVGEDLGSYNKMTEELNQARTSFAITPDRDSAMRTMLKRQRELEAKAKTGSLTDQEHVALVKTYQIFDSVAARMAQAQYDDQGNYISAQGTPESQAVIKEAVASRQLQMTNYDDVTGSRTLLVPHTSPPGFIGPPPPPSAVQVTRGGAIIPPPPVSGDAARSTVARNVPKP
jgi:hypothetical protein